MGPPREVELGAAEFYRRYGRPSRPVVITGVADRWEARRKWTFEWLAATHGHVQVPIGDKYGVVRDRRELSLAEYLARVQVERAGESGYLANLDLARLIPSLAQDFAFPPYPPIGRLTLVNFWIGPQGTLAKLHRDFAYNLLAQLRGSKRVLLFSPARTPALGEHGATWYAAYSGHDPEEPGSDALQLPSPVEPDYDFTLSEGEMLFIPYGWWHRVLSLQPSISVNLWWWTVPMFLARLPHLARDKGKELLRGLMGS